MPIDWNTWQVRLGRGGRVRCEPGWRIDDAWMARLRDFDLWFVWAGRGVMRLSGGATLSLRPGVALWMRPGRCYLAEQDPDHRLGVTFIHFDLIGRDGKPSLTPRGLPAEVHHVADAPYVDAATRRVLALSNGPARERAAAQRLMTALLMDLDAAATTAPKRGVTAASRRHESIVTELASLIRESPAEAPSIRELAARANCSTDHLTRMFRRVVGTGPQQFIVQARIDRAKLLLHETAMTVTQIADALGYGDVFHFSRQFAQKAGVTPTAYRVSGGRGNVSQRRGR
jgi:AraC-like DNA-binding protein